MPLPMPVGLPVLQLYVSGVTPIRLPVFVSSVCSYVLCAFSQAHPFVGKLWARYTYIQVGGISTYFSSMYVCTPQVQQFSSCVLRLLPAV